MLRKITIKQKIYALAIFGSLLAISIAGIAMYKINAIGIQLEQIAKEDIPLTTNVTEITVHQLEQAIFFERSVRFAERMHHDPAAKKSYDKYKKKFLEYAKKVDAEILHAEETVAHIIKHEKSHGGEQEIINEFIHVEEILKKIEQEHKTFDHDVEKIFKLFETGKIAETKSLIENVEKQEGKIEQELTALLFELEKFTADAALKAEHTEKLALKLLIKITIIANIIFLICSVIIVRGIVRPLLATRHYADELSNGNLSVEQPTHNFKDEIADMMESLSVFKDNAIESKQLREDQKLRDAEAEIEKKQAMAALAESFDSQVGGMINALAAASTELQSTAESMKVVSDQTKESSATVAASSEESSANVNSVAAAMEEMSATSAEIATQVTAASGKSSDTAQNAAQANETVNNLNVLTDSIGEVVGAIQDISEQTNLLALNATIEAARAGDAGKGFAVVADEVKKLANETGQKTEEIGTKISEIQEATRASVTAMQRIISNISEIDQSVGGVSAAVEEQNATTSEIVRSVTEASQGVQQVSQTIVDVQTGAEQTGSSAGALLDAANEVSQLSEQLKHSVDSFLNDIRGE